MTTPRPSTRSPSLIRQLALAHAAVGFLGLVVGAFVLNRTLSQVVWQEHRRAILASGADVLARLAIEGPAGLAREMPPETLRRFDASTGSMRYAVMDAAGHVIVASPGALPALPREAGGVLLPAFQDGQDGSLLWGFTQDLDTPAGRLRIQIAQDMSRSYVVLDEVPVAALGPTLFVLACGGLILFTLDAALLLLMLRPLRQAARQAERIGGETPARLSAEGMPLEVRPLIAAVNAGLDRLDEALAWQRGFSEEVAHELRTPLSIIQAELDLLEPGPARDRLRQDVAGLSQLVGDLLEAAEAARELPAAQAVFDLAELARETAARLAGLAERDGRSLSGPPPGIPLPVRGNRDALGRAIRNLVDNALSHTPPGTAVEVRLPPASQPGVALVAVADHGPGVPLAERALVFRRRWRAGDTHRRGLGLGLSIVERVVRAHGGRVAVEDNPGGGAVFVIALPLAEPAEAAE